MVLEKTRTYYRLVRTGRTFERLFFAKCIMLGMFEDSIASALAFVETDGYATYDPYDIKALPIYQNLLGKLVVNAGATLAPFATRRMLGVKRMPSAGGVAHLAEAYLSLGNRDGAKGCLDWLETNQAEGFPTEHESAWGLPFGWKSTVGDARTNTPIGHTTMTAGNAYLAFGGDRAIEMAERACWFLVRHLKRHEFDSGSLALGYTTNDRSWCVNANADNASLLARVGAKTGNEEFLDLAIKMARFVVEFQNPDGSWNYFADDSESIIDNYHTGMTLTALQKMAYVTFGDDLHDSFAKGLDFYLKELFLLSGHPKFSTSKIWPVDAYSCGQAMLTLADASSDLRLPAVLRSKALSKLGEVATFTVNEMQSRNGSFLFRRYKFAKVRLGSLRWAQAICLWGLSRAQVALGPGVE